MSGGVIVFRLPSGEVVPLPLNELAARMGTGDRLVHKALGSLTREGLIELLADGTYAVRSTVLGQKLAAAETT